MVEKQPCLEMRAEYPEELTTAHDGIYAAPCQTRALNKSGSVALTSQR